MTKEMPVVVHDPFDALALVQAWDSLVSYLPPRHHLLITGPHSDGHYSVGVISNVSGARQVASGRGPLVFALQSALAEFLFLSKMKEEANG